MAYGLEVAEPAPRGRFGELEPVLLDCCLRACQEVHGAPFEAEPALLQLAHAGELYNLVIRMAHQAGKSPADIMRLEVKGLAEQLRLFLKMGWARPYPAPNLPGVFF